MRLDSPSAHPVAEGDSPGREPVEAPYGGQGQAPAKNAGCPPSIGDFNSFIFPNGPDDGHGVFAYFGHTVPDAGRVNEERWDLSPNGVIDIGDINALNPMVTAASARPPMFNGQQAFFAGACPWPP